MVLWLHGCGRGCPGCIAADWNRKKGPALTLSVETVLRSIASCQDLEGVTISGGEPFRQDAALGQLVSALRGRELGVIIYTGHTLAELRPDPRAGIQQALGGCDTLVDGPYDQALDDGQAFRGSSNQTIHHFTSRYREYFSSGVSRRSAFRQEDGRRYLLGIPDEAARERWADIKRSAGIAPEKEEEMNHGGECGRDRASAPGAGGNQP